MLSGMVNTLLQQEQYKHDTYIASRDRRRAVLEAVSKALPPDLDVSYHQNTPLWGSEVLVQVDLPKTMTPEEIMARTRVIYDGTVTEPTYLIRDVCTSFYPFEEANKMRLKMKEDPGHAATHHHRIEDVLPLHLQAECTVDSCGHGSSRGVWKWYAVAPPTEAKPSRTLYRMEIRFENTKLVVGSFTRQLEHSRRGYVLVSHGYSFGLGKERQTVRYAGGVDYMPTYIAYWPEGTPVETALTYHPENLKEG